MATYKLRWLYCSPCSCAVLRIFKARNRKGRWDALLCTSTACSILNAWCLSLPSGHVFNNRCDPLPTTDAKGGNTILQVIAPQFVHQRKRHTSAACRQRVTNRDSAAVDICLIALQAQFFLHGKILRGECLIDLHAVEIIQAQIGSFEGLANSGSRADTHNLGR